MKKGSQNDAKIDAKIIKKWFWAAKGAANVDLEYSWVVFWKIWIFDDFRVLQKSAKNRTNADKVFQKAKFSEARRNERGGREGGEGLKTLRVMQKTAEN